MKKKQVEQGAPVDFIFLASKNHLYILVNEKLVKKPKDVFKNSLVVIGNKKIESLKDLTNFKVAIGDPGFVPAGQYAKESLISKRVWKELKSNLILTKDVKSALAYIQKNEIDFAIVYSTDAALVKGKEVYEINEASHTPIVYSAGIINGTKEGEEFCKYLLKNKGLFKKYGFKVN